MAEPYFPQAPERRRVTMSPIVVIIALAAFVLTVAFTAYRRWEDAKCAAMFNVPTTADLMGKGAAAPPLPPLPPAPPAPPLDPKLAGPAAQQAYLIGLLRFQRGDYAQAREAWEQALKTDPNNADAKAGLERLAELGQ